MKAPLSDQDLLKDAVAQKAVALVEEGMLLGLGTGTTATFFIQHLIERVQEGLKIQAVSSSVRSLDQAKAGGIPVLEMSKVESIDLTIDGADEVDPKNRLIKGGGGAHVREKIIAHASRKMVVIVDESKLVDQLGAFGVPIEILPFGLASAIAHIEAMGYRGKLRTKEDGSLYVTDNSNYLYDIHFPERFAEPEVDHDKIVNVVGVVETGFFFNLPIQVLVGYTDGRVEFR